ncbi:MAG: hypothetical protein AAF922_06635 [Pseudomonadota bacterium]
MTRYDMMYDYTTEDWHELLLMGVDPDVSHSHEFGWVMDRFDRIFGRIA